MAKNQKKELDGFERGVIFVGLGSYVVIAVGILIQSLLAWGIKSAMDAFMPLIFWLIIGVVLLVGWMMTEGALRFFISMIPLAILALGLIGGLNQLSRSIEARKPPDEFFVYPTPMPGTSPDSLSEEQKDWVGEKYTFNLSKGPGATLLGFYFVVVAAYFVNIYTRRKIGMQILIFIVWLFFIFMMRSIRLSYPDLATEEAARTLFKWGAAQSIAWMVLKQVFSFVIGLLREGSYTMGRKGAMLVAALTFPLTSFLFKLITPDTVTIYFATNYAHQTSLTVNMAYSLIYNGMITFIAADGAYNSIKNIIKKILDPEESEEEKKKKAQKAAEAKQAREAANANQK